MGGVWDSLLRKTGGDCVRDHLPLTNVTGTGYNNYRGDVMESLANARRGETCTIKWMFGSPGVMEWMENHHIRQGSQVTVIQNTIDSLIVAVNDMRLAMSRDVAERIKY